MDKNAEWIWAADSRGKDEYAEFNASFKLSGEKNVVLKISCDGVYSVNVNGKLAAFSACADYPDFKFYDEIDITKFCKKNNIVIISVWHSGVDCLSYICDTAGVIFEISEDGKNVFASDKNTPSRIMNEYKNGYLKKINFQLGLSFLFDNTVLKNGFSTSVEVKKTYDLHKRGIKKLILGKRPPISLIKKEKSVIVDLGQETAGFLDIDVVSPVNQKILFAYGEHLKDGNVRRIIDYRDFSVEFVAKAGRNKYMNSFRRIAGRYIEIFCEKEIEIKYVGIRPVIYPVRKNPKKFKDELTQKIYDTSVKTLKLCMHEHYEDCPWREQALYILDSRNQMLCGYYAFKGGNKEYARHNIVLISKGLRKDGLLSLCFPAGIDIPIPFFSLSYVLQVFEYVKYTKDKSILDEVGKAIRTIIKTFDGKIEENGLIPSLPYPYWNFYEWAEESDNEWQTRRTEKDVYVKSYDLILNCFYVYCVKLYDELFGEKHDVERVKSAIEKTFYNGKTFKLSTATEKCSQFGNALAMLIGFNNAELAETIISDESIISATLSVRPFLYDALLAFGDKYKKYIVNDIKERYKIMLDCGATSFWETEKGEADFDGAGSLCHGWSAMPVYYFRTGILD